MRVGALVDDLIAAAPHLRRGKVDAARREATLALLAAITGIDLAVPWASTVLWARVEPHANLRIDIRTDDALRSQGRYDVGVDADQRGASERRDGRGRPLGPARGAMALIREAVDGTVTIHGNGHALPCRLHPREQAQLVPGVVVEHNHLDGVFAWIAAQQCEWSRGWPIPRSRSRAKTRIQAALP
jgi:hypothetical protein